MIDVSPAALLSVAQARDWLAGSKIDVSHAVLLGVAQARLLAGLRSASATPRS